jgi:hypothetical protein
MKHARRRMLAALPLALAAGVARAQQGGWLISTGGHWSVGAPAGQASHTIAGVQNQVWLPHVVAPGPLVQITFYGQLGDTVVGPGRQFPSGITGLFYEIQITGAAGMRFREEWQLSGRLQPQLGAEGTIPGSPATRTNTILLGSGGPLPAGTYRLRFFIDDLIFADIAVAVG